MVSKKAVSIICICAIMLMNLFIYPIKANALEELAAPLDLEAKSAVLMEVTTGTFIFKKNANEKLPFASMTKIMSMLLIMEAIDNGKINYTDKVPTSEHAYSMGGTQVWLKPGEVFTVEEMLKAVAIHSANDATVALAEKVAGSEDAFVALMNQKAQDLGLMNTLFLDCTGLTDEGHYSTAEDLAVISRELLMKYPEISDFVTIRHDTFRNGTVDLDNTNKLAGTYSGLTGLKTGFTTKAGYCLSASAKRGNLYFISVVMGLSSDNKRSSESAKILDYAFANYELVEMEKKGDLIDQISVKKGLEDKVPVVAAMDIQLLIKKGSREAIKREIQLTEQFEAPVVAGDAAGKVHYLIDGKTIGEVSVVTEKNIERASFFQLFAKLIKKWFKISGKG